MRALRTFVSLRRLPVLLLLPESNQQAAQAQAEEIRASAASESFRLKAIS